MKPPNSRSTARAKASGVRSSNSGPMIWTPIGRPSRNPDWNDGGRQSARRCEFGPRQVMKIGKFLALDGHRPRFLGRRRIVSKGGRRSRRTDDDVEVAKQNAPLLFETLTGEIGTQPFAMAHHGAARELGDHALIVGGNFLDRGAHFLISIVRQSCRQDSVQQLGVEPSRGRQIRQERASRVSPRRRRRPSCFANRSSEAPTSGDVGRSGWSAMNSTRKSASLSRRAGAGSSDSRVPRPRRLGRR